MTAVTILNPPRVLPTQNFALKRGQNLKTVTESQKWQNHQWSAISKQGFGGTLCQRESMRDLNAIRDERLMVIWDN